MIVNRRLSVSGYVAYVTCQPRGSNKYISQKLGALAWKKCKFLQYRATKVRDQVDCKRWQ